MRFRDRTTVNDEQHFLNSFSEFFTDVFTKTDRIQEIFVEFKPNLFNKVIIDETKIEQILEKLDTIKA